VTDMNRRQFLGLAASVGASVAWARGGAQPSRIVARERRDLYPEGVASGDPDTQSVLLWTRRPPARRSPSEGGFATASPSTLRVEVSEDPAFTRVVSTARTKVSPTADWTCRVLVGNLKPATVYWYRFVDQEGNASRTGRTVTAPAADDRRAVKFAFVSCQNANDSSLHAYRRMIAEDERADAGERLGFVLHLGDFIYEAVWYPSDNPHGFSGRPLRDLVRYPHGERIDMGPYGKIHIPTTLEDYRAVYRAYLHDPDLQDARARWPFVCIWDNHEFSWAGWQSVQLFNGENRPAQTRKVAADQAWFEYQPARITKASGTLLETFDAPSVRDAPIRTFDDNGFGDEPNNRIAVGSLTGYRSLSWGRNLELIITDQRSYRSETPGSRPEMARLTSDDFPYCVPQETLEILDAGRTYGNNAPPVNLRFGTEEIPNFRKSEPPQTILGDAQKKWFLERLTRSTATWKVWGNSQGTLDQRLDPQNLPAGLTTAWPGAGYALGGGGDPSTAFIERAEIYATVRRNGITGFATVCGDRHSFWAGLAAPSLPPQPFEPVGVAFVTGSISTAGMFESVEYTLPKDHPLRALFVAQRTADSPAEPTVNLLHRHGVRSALEYHKTGNIDAARALSNPNLAPHLAFLDLGGHGYATVRVSSDALECEFVCIPRPIERTVTLDGGPLLYRVVHRAPLWKSGEKPRLEQRVIEGNPALSL
jgi:alkaline phosphatase D